MYIVIYYITIIKDKLKFLSPHVERFKKTGFYTIYVDNKIFLEILAGILLLSSLLLLSLYFMRSILDIMVYTTINLGYFLFY